VSSWDYLGCLLGTTWDVMGDPKQKHSFLPFQSIEDLL